MSERVALLRGVRIAGRDRALAPVDGPLDIAIADGVIADIAPAGALPTAGRVLEMPGAYVLPGLWDHHVHVVQWALAAQRVPLGHAESAAHAAALMGAAAPLEDGTRVGSGYRDAFWADAPTLALLDAATGEVPTYLINADVHSAWLNSAALRREGFEAVADGVLREEPAFEISRRMNNADPRLADGYVRRMAERAAARGVVGIRDFDLAWNAGAWRRRLEAGFDALRVSFGIYAQDLPRALREGLRSGDPIVAGDLRETLVRVGPFKAITDGSLGTRTAACAHPYPDDPHNHGQLTIAPDELRALMTAATGGGLECAIHAIGDVANSHALDAFAATGATGSIEHAQLLARTDIPRFARGGIAASVQPEHALDDRDLTDTIWAAQTSAPYPLRSLRDAGANLLLGSDAPVSPLDPWAAIAGAVYRTRDGRGAWQPHETIDIDTAIAASSRNGSADASAADGGGASAVVVGAIADLAVCGADPAAADEAGLRAMPVLATLLGGRLTHLA